MTVGEVRNLVEGGKPGITYKIRNLITGRVLCGRNLKPLGFISESEAEAFILNHGLCPENHEIIPAAFMKLAWSDTKNRHGDKKMNNSKDEFVTNELTMLLKAIDGMIDRCTYTSDEKNEFVTVWFKDSDISETACITGDSHAQLTVDVLRKIIM